jgi:uncharacterized protein YndB with AHSA1/START domain
MINAPAEHVWDLVSDVTRMGEWSPETRGCRWLDDAAGPSAGARFTGSNAHRGRRWRTICTVIAADRGREFAFDVVGGGFLQVATWRYEFVLRDGGCTVIETSIDRRGPLLRLYGRMTLGIADRTEHNQRTMTETLARLKSSAEAPTAPWRDPGGPDE